MKQIIMTRMKERIMGIVMKKYGKILFFSLLFLMLFSVNAFAETKEVTLEINGEYTDAAFYITWENYEQNASVEIIAPDGTSYSKSSAPEAVYEARGEAIVRVGQAAQGTWTVRVTGDNLGVIDVSAGQIPDSLVIDSFSVSDNGGKYEASYAVSDCPDNIRVEIFADTDNQGYDGTSVYSGSGASAGTAELNMSGLSAGEYHFYLRVSVDGIYKRAYANEVVSYQLPEVTEKVNNVTGGKYNDGYYISWDCEKENDRFQVYVWDENLNLKQTEELQGEDFFYGDFEENETSVYLAVVKSGKKCNYDKIQVSADTTVDAQVTFDVEANITSHKFITADITFDGNYSIDAYLNGEEQIKNEKEAGTYKISMSDGENVVIFCIADEHGNRKEFVKTIYVDTVPPALSVTEDINNLTVSKNYVYLSGYSEAGAELTLNGKTIEMKKGYFNEKVKLSLGKNKIKLVATDSAGNQSSYTATVEYRMSRNRKTTWYVVISAAALLFVIYLIVFIRGIKRKKKNK